MFSNIGWGEIFFIILLGLIVIGPERLPGVLEDVRAAIYAARKAITNAKAELNGELGEFEEFRQPMETVSKYAAMGPKRAITQMLFDGDEHALDDIDPRTALNDSPQARTPKPPVRRNPDGSRRQDPPASGGGFSWADIT